MMSVKFFGLTIKLPVVFEVVEKNRELRWCGCLRWLMCGHHYFKIEAVNQENTATKLIQGETFHGIGLPILWTIIKKQLMNLYDDSNQAIKKRAELLVKQP